MSALRGIFMDSFSDRLKEERTRMSVNQSEFAKIGGVQKNAQIKYEKGERSPDVDYLQRISASGVDVLYLLTGRRDGQKKLSQSTENLLIDAIATQLYLGSCVDELDPIFYLLQDEHDAWVKSGGNAADEGNRSRNALRAWLTKSPFVILDHVEIEDVIEKLEFTLDVTGKVMSYRDKAAAIMSLFRQTKELPKGQRIGMDMFKAVVDRNGIPKPKG
jgi:transcriptional regulator with XRE-family HTH domain